MASPRIAGGRSPGRSGSRSASCALVVLSALTMATCGDSSGTDVGGTPAEMQVLGGNAQDGTVGEELPDPLVVKVTDERGRPVRGQLVNWRVTAGGGSVFAGSALTDARGEARERWTLGTVASAAQQVEARAVENGTGAPLVFATFSATAKVGPATALAAVTTGTHEGSVGQALAIPMAVRASDRYDNPIAGMMVTWEASPGGSTSPASSTTDAAGEARTTWTLGAAPGSQQLTARSGTLPPATFTAMARVGALHRLEIVAGQHRDGEVGLALGEPLVVRAIDAVGNPISGVSVSWSTEHGFLSTGTEPTNESGQSSAVWTLGTAAGSQSATARAQEVEPVAFTALAKPGPPDRQLPLGGGAQQATVGTSLLEPLAVRVLDRYSNPVPGVPVTWTLATPDAGEIIPSGPTTNEAGEASAQWTLGARSGTVVVMLTLGSLPAIRFEAYAVPVTATRLELISGGGQQGAVGAALANPVVVRALDIYGTPVPGPTVQFTASHGGSFAAASTMANEQGLASSRWTLGATLGEQSATASIGTSATVAIGASAVAGPPASVEILGGDAQEGPVGVMLPQPLTVRVRDAYGHPVRATVAWSSTQGSGTVDPRTSSTDDDGVAATRWVVGMLGDGNRVIAGVGTVSATFRATGLAGGRARLESAVLAWAGGPPGADAGTVYSSYAARVRLFGADGAPVANAAVAWTVTGGGSVSPSSSTTDGSGYATTSWRLGTIVGENTLTARALDAESLTFRITTHADRVCSADIQTEDRSTSVSGRVGELTDVPLYAFSRDQFGNPTGGYGASPYPYPTNLGYSIEGSFSTDATGRSGPVYVRVGTSPSTQEFLYPGYLCQGTSFGLLTPRLQTYSFRVSAYEASAP